MEIKQLKRFFFCLYFNPVLSRNSFTTSVLQMYIVGNLVQQNLTCILYFGDVTFWLCRTLDNSKFFLILNVKKKRKTKSKKRKINTKNEKSKVKNE